jgi:hypothetical protein
MSQPLTYRSSLVWLGQVFVHWRRWIGAHWRMTLVISAVAFVFGWLWNTYIMAVDLEGSAIDPDTDTIALAEGRNGNALFWLLLFSLVGGVITYAWSRGPRMFLSDLAALPRQFGNAMSRSPAVAFAMLLWGTSISLIIATLISSAVSLALGLVLLFLAATPVGVILNFALVRVWRALYGIVAPKTDARLGLTTGPFMVMLGEALGLFIDWMFGNWVLGLVLGIACAVGSVLVVRATPSPQATMLIVFGGIVLAMQVLRMQGAYADDGGWSECVSSDGGPCTGITGLFDWLRSPGADAVITRGAVGGLSAAVGAALGVGAAGAGAGLAAAGVGAAGAAGVGAAGAAAGLAAAGAEAAGMMSGPTQPDMPTQAGTQAAGTTSGPATPEVPTQPGYYEATESGHSAEPPTRPMPTAPEPASLADDAGGPQGTVEQPMRLEAYGLAQDVGGQLSVGDLGQLGHAGAAASPDVSDLLPEQPDRRKDDDEASEQ